MLKYAVALSLVTIGCKAEHRVINRACAVPFVAAPTIETPMPIGAMREISAFNSIVEQTDSTPCIGATGIDICARAALGERLCATRAYPFEQRLLIAGWGICTVVDRSADKYADRIDLYFGNDIEGAKAYGVQRRLVIPL